MRAHEHSKNRRHFIEILEPRIAPASVLAYTDIDGDHVKISVSKGALTAGGNVTFTAGGTVGGEYPSEINLSDPSFNGANLTISVTKVKGGDGQARVGPIIFGTNDLNTVKIAGDLDEISGGSGSGTAIKALMVDSLGRYPATAESDIIGNVGTVAVKDDLQGIYFRVTGTLTSISIGGSVIGGATGDTGEVYATDSIGSVAIGHDLRGGLGAFSGSIGAGVNVGQVTIGGSIYGGDGTASGSLYAAYLAVGGIKSVTVHGGVYGGAGDDSGAIGYSANGSNLSLGTVVIGKDLTGNGGAYSGSIQAYASSAGPITIKGSVVGGTGDFSGSAGAGTFVSSFTVGGSIYGGMADHSGYLYAAFTDNGSIQSINVHGSLVGGAGLESGAIGGEAVTTAIYELTFGTVVVGGDVIGGSGMRSGSVDAYYSQATSMTVKGSVIGGMGQISGYVAAHHVGTLAIGGSVYGGNQEYSGSLYMQDGADHVTIGGSLIGGSGKYTGIFEVDMAGVGQLTIHGDLRGAGGTESGSVIVAPSITSKKIDGQIIPGSGMESGMVMG